MPTPTISTDVFVNRLRDSLRNPDNRICFVLGAGASVESGISSGATLAKQWHSELPLFHNEQRIAEWKAQVNFNEKDVPAHYAQLFKLRYEGHQDDGIHQITSEIEKGSPGFGYTILSQVLQQTHHNVVITTNFDTLTEESLYVFTNKRALVCNHENLAHLARPSRTRPLVVKIHRGLYMDPLNNEDDIAELKPQWERALTDIFRNYIPVVVGYGGNDDSLMNYLRQIAPCQRLYWCIREGNVPRADIAEVVERHRGQFVTIGGFNRLMFRFIDLFGLSKLHEVMAETAKERAEKLRGEYEEAAKDIGQSGSEQEKQELGRIAEDFDTGDWLQWQIKAAATKDPAAKKAIYQQALAALPQSHQLHYNLGCLFAECGEYNQAIAAFQKAVDIKPDKHEAWNNMGSAYDDQKEYDKAIEAYQKAVDIKPDLHEAWYNMGNVYREQKEYDKAIALYQKAADIKPDLHEAWYNMGNAYREQKEYDKAITAFQKAVDIKPDKQEAWNNMGSMHYRQKAYDKAITAFQKAVEIKPDKHEAWYNMGITYEHKADTTNARRCYAKAHRLNPNNEIYKKAVERLN
jgi:protein O-mannosyl-transferase